FDVYSDRLPRDAQGRLMNERPASQVIDEAIAWLGAPSSPRFFLWVHLFEPHAPYGSDPSRPVLERYDEEIATAHRETGRLLGGPGARAGETLIGAAGDHGEAFGEHGEFAHSIFIYDTPLRVPFVMRGPGIAEGTSVADAVTLADIAPTAARRLGVEMR